MQEATKKIQLAFRAKKPKVKVEVPVVAPPAHPIPVPEEKSSPERLSTEKSASPQPDQISSEKSSSSPERPQSSGAEKSSIDRSSAERFFFFINYLEASYS